ncbi:acyl carrier protein [Roseomonas sp. F4]
MTSERTPPAAPDALETRLLELVTEHLGREAGEVTLDSNFEDDLGADSLDTIELAMGFEEEWGIVIMDDEIEGLETVRDALALVREKRAAL